MISPQPLIALAGLAEAAIGMHLNLCYLGLLIIAIMTTAGLIFRSPVQATIAIVLLAVVSLVLAPWVGFIPDDPANLNDSDAVYWSKRFFTLAIVWSVATVYCIGSAVWLFRSVKQEREQDREADDPTPAANAQ